MYSFIPWQLCFYNRLCAPFFSTGDLSTLLFLNKKRKKKKKNRLALIDLKIDLILLLLNTKNLHPQLSVINRLVACLKGSIDADKKLKTIPKECASANPSRMALRNKINQRI